MATTALADAKDAASESAVTTAAASAAVTTFSCHYPAEEQATTRLDLGPTPQGHWIFSPVTMIRA